ncbi:MAG: BlaI/MecI/CopY family transcriptional regulator [Candidatus Tumulicola sp.]
MSRKKSLTLTDHELRLMDVLWERGRATVADVVDGLLPPPLAYTTVLTTLRTLEQKGYVAYEGEGRA